MYVHTISLGYARDVHNVPYTRVSAYVRVTAAASVYSSPSLSLFVSLFIPKQRTHKHVRTHNVRECSTRTRTHRGSHAHISIAVCVRAAVCSSM